MNFRENIKQGFESIRSNSLRAIITCLIIAIGIAALVGILTSIDGMKNAITKTFSRMGSQSFNIRNGNNMRRHGGPGSVVDFKSIDYNQANQFKRDFNYPAKISISKNSGNAYKARYGTKETNPNISVIGIDENYLVTSGYELEKGRNFTTNDVDLALPVALIGRDVSDPLMGKKVKMGAEILVDGKRYIVVGQLATKGSSMGMNNGDRIVFLPVSRARQDFTMTGENYFLNVSVEKPEQLDPAMDEAYLLMRRLRGLKAGEKDNFLMAKSDAIAKEAIDDMKSVTLIGTIIAIITLLGAAISLMNIMLVSVTERTREIGVRKSLGASAGTIRNQFLTEAVVITQIGGAGGILLGMLLGNLVAMTLGSGFIIPWLWMLVAVVVCMVVGLAAGIYPANKAAKMDPIDALRYE